MQNIPTTFHGNQSQNDDRAFISEQITAMAERWRAMLASYRSVWSLLQRHASLPSHEVEKLVEQIANLSTSIERLEPAVRFQSFLDEARIINRLGRICWALDSHATSVRQVWLRITELLAPLCWTSRLQGTPTSSPESRSSWNATVSKQMGLLPPPSCVQASLDEELAAARLVLAARSKEVGNDGDTPTERTAKVPTTRRTLTINNWESLVIAYANDNQIWAFSLPLRLGARIAVKKGSLVDIRSMRWKRLISLLASAPDGRTLSFPDAWTALCQRTDGETTPAEKRSQLTAPELKILRQATAEITRQLRRALGGPTGHHQAPIRIQKGKQCLQARFQTRRFVLDGSEHGHFENAPNVPEDDP